MISDIFWRGKRVFLTGHTGFKGSWLSLWLQKLGADVIGYSLLPPTSFSVMPCGHQLIEAVAANLSTEEGFLVGDLLHKSGRSVTMRAIRYAITELIKSGRARRDKRNGPIYAVRSE